MIITKFSESGWDLIDGPSKVWLESEEKSSADASVTKNLIQAVEQADVECGSCGCEFDPLYKRALETLKA